MNTRNFKGKMSYVTLFAALIALLIFLFFVSFLCGRFSEVSAANIPKILLQEIFSGIQTTWTDAESSVVLHMRLPRIVAAIFIGAALSMSGATYQAIFANPVASPDTLGVSSGAAFGAVLGILLNMGSFEMKISAFLFGCVAVGLVYLFSSLLTRMHNMTIYLILIGMVISSMFTAFLAITKYVADPEKKLPQITYWLMGSLSNVNQKDVIYYLFFFLAGAIPLYLLRWRMNFLSLSDYEAKSLGENTNSLRMVTIIGATVLTAASTAMTGGIGWIGLIIPHMARLLVGHDFRRILPVSALMGSSFLLLMDDLARSVSINEIPISILTSLVGAPVFFMVLIGNKRNRRVLFHED